MDAALSFVNALGFLALPIVLVSVVHNSILIFRHAKLAGRSEQPADWFYFRRLYESGDKAGKAFTYSARIGFVACGFYVLPILIRLHQTMS
jgi:hypothetical protein